MRHYVIGSVITPPSSPPPPLLLSPTLEVCLEVGGGVQDVKWRHRGIQKYVLAWL